MDEEQVTTTETTTQATAPGATRRTSTVSTAGTPSGSVLAERLVYFIIGLIEALLAIRFVLSLFGANRNNGFADFIYGITAPFVSPFMNLFNVQTTFGASRFEVETLVAMIVVALVGWVLSMLFRLPRRTAAV